MWRDGLLVAMKDLRIEARSKVAIGQLVPFALLLLILFAFGLDVDLDSGTLALLGPGLFWAAVLFAAVLAVQRSFAIEADDAGRDGLRLSGLDPAGIFLGKTAAVVVQLLVLEAALAVGLVVMYGTRIRGPLLLGVTTVTATIGVAATGILFGALASGTRVRDTLVPVLFLPVAAPALLAATRASKAAIGSDAATAARPGSARLIAVVGEGWPWARLLVVFTVVAVSIGIIAFGPLLEDA